MDKHIEVYPYNEILFSTGNKQYIYITTWMNLKSIILTAKHKRLHIVGFHLYKILEKARLYYRNKWLEEAEGCGGG